MHYMHGYAKYVANNCHNSYYLEQFNWYYSILIDFLRIFVCICSFRNVSAVHINYHCILLCPSSLLLFPFNSLPLLQLVTLAKSSLHVPYTPFLLGPPFPLLHGVGMLDWSRRLGPPNAPRTRRQQSFCRNLV